MIDKKVALVTGANRGIGHEVLKSLASSGHVVIGTSRSPEGVNKINNTLKRLKAQGYGTIFDLSLIHI